MAADRSLPRFQPQRPLGPTGFTATAVGIGDLTDRSVPPAQCVATLHRAMVMFPVGPFVHPRYVEEILPLARAKGVGTVCFKTFGAGTSADRAMVVPSPENHERLVRQPSAVRVFPAQ